MLQTNSSISMLKIAPCPNRFGIIFETHGTLNMSVSSTRNACFHKNAVLFKMCNTWNMLSFVFKIYPKPIKRVFEHPSPSGKKANIMMDVWWFSSPRKDARSIQDPVKTGSGSISEPRWSQRQSVRRVASDLILKAVLISCSIISERFWKDLDNNLKQLFSYRIYATLLPKHIFLRTPEECPTVSKPLKKHPTFQGPIRGEALVTLKWPCGGFWNNNQTPDKVNLKLDFAKATKYKQ